MARGIERRPIFADDADRTRFLNRLSRVLGSTATRCFAYSLMPNHYHLLLETRATPLSRVMLRLGTWHAMDFNHRHERVGHLFQNRFKSKLVEDEAGFLTVVRYIHLNPVRAQIVPSIPALASYPWTGHATLLGRRREAFLDAQAVLSCFAVDTRAARRALARFMQGGLDDGDPEPDFDGREGSLAAQAASWTKTPLPDDALERDLDRRRLQEAGWDVDRLLVAVSRHEGTDPELLRAGRRTFAASRAREALAGLAVDSLGVSQTAVARATGVTQQAVTQAIARFAAWPPGRRSEVRGLLRTAPPAS
jgi:REP element-mobilizing transposase RayT